MPARVTSKAFRISACKGSADFLGRSSSTFRPHRSGGRHRKRIGRDGRKQNARSFFLNVMIGGAQVANVTDVVRGLQR